MKLLIELPEDADAAAISDILQTVAEEILEPDFDDRELMDGSHPIETEHGTVFISHQEEE